MRISFLLKAFIGCAVLYGGLLLVVGGRFLGFGFNVGGYIVKYNDARLTAITNIQPLIDLGLVVPRWNDEPEAPAVAGGPGEERPELIIVVCCHE
jgi:hypothetical protein